MYIKKKANHRMVLDIHPVIFDISKNALTITNNCPTEMILIQFLNVVFIMLNVIDYDTIVAKIYQK